MSMSEQHSWDWLSLTKARCVNCGLDKEIRTGPQGGRQIWLRLPSPRETFTRHKQGARMPKCEG